METAYRRCCGMDVHKKSVTVHVLPPQGQSAIWKYKMVYIFKNKQVATWSDEVTITVYGPTA